MVAGGIDFKTISGYIEHSDVGFTMNTYAHLAQSQYKKASEKLGEQLSLSEILKSD